MRSERRSLERAIIISETSCGEGGRAIGSMIKIRIASVAFPEETANQEAYRLSVTNRRCSGNARSHLRYSRGHVPVENFCHNHCSFERRVLKALLVYISQDVSASFCAQALLLPCRFLSFPIFPSRLISIGFNAIEAF